MKIKKKKMTALGPNKGEEASFFVYDVGDKRFSTRREAVEYIRSKRAEKHDFVFG